MKYLTLVRLAKWVFWVELAPFLNSNNHHHALIEQVFWTFPIVFEQYSLGLNVVSSSPEHFNVVLHQSRAATRFPTTEASSPPRVEVMTKCPAVGEGSLHLKTHSSRILFVVIIHCVSIAKANRPRPESVSGFCNGQVRPQNPWRALKWPRSVWLWLVCMHACVLARAWTLAISRSLVDAWTLESLDPFHLSPVKCGSLSSKTESGFVVVDLCVCVDSRTKLTLFPLPSNPSMQLTAVSCSPMLKSWTIPSSIVPNPSVAYRATIVQRLCKRVHDVRSCTARWPTSRP